MKETDARLRNWARVYKDRRKRSASPFADEMLRGARAEMTPGRKLPPVWEDLELRSSDPKDAAIVERALCSPEYPERFRRLVTAAYLHPGRPVHVICRAAHVSQRRFPSLFGQALRALETLLQNFENMAE